MKLFQQFATAVAAGVVFHLTIRRAGDEMQLEILPVGDAGKTGIVIPPQALIATPAELDAAVPGFLDTYLASTKNLSDQMAAANAAMVQAEADAKVAVQKAATAKPASAGKPASAVIPTKKRTAVTLLGDEDDEDDVPGAASAGEEDVVAVATAPVGTPAVPASMFM